MARVTNGELARRVLSFLHGLNDQRAGCALAASGFTNDDVDEGWRLHVVVREKIGRAHV